MTPSDVYLKSTPFHLWQKIPTKNSLIEAFYKSFIRLDTVSSVFFTKKGGANWGKIKDRVKI